MKEDRRRTNVDLLLSASMRERDGIKIARRALVSA
jgi:hypothetical protein